MNKTALVMSGGGARGAYQAGVIKALEEILRPLGKFPFDILVGASAGSINAGALATNSHNFNEAARQLENLWGKLEAHQVIKTDIRSLGKIGASWIRDLSFGGVLGGGLAQSLLDTEPLRDLLTQNFNGPQLKKNIEAKHIYALAISATNVYTTNSVCFIQGHPNIDLWVRHKRVSEIAELTVEHLMASSAIPIFFPSIEIQGRHFTDGCIGNIAPLSPAVHLGANKIIAVGVRNYGMDSETNLGPRNPPAIAHIAGLLLNAIFMDAIEMDIQRMMRINEVMALAAKGYENQEHWKPIEVIQISPSENIGHLAGEYFRDIPRVVRYLMKGLGDQGSTEELASYLLFDTSFCTRLIEMGYNDALKERDKIEKLLLI